MCQTKDAPIQDWVRLAVSRARETGTPAVFWLDETRAHDAELLRKVSARHSTSSTPTGVEIEILDVAEAARLTLERARDGKDTISVTGNVLRDYLTDLFPILELGTSAKMLSIVPLCAGRRAVRDRRRRLGAASTSSSSSRRTTCAGTRWASSSRSARRSSCSADKTDNPRAKLLADTLDRATGRVLEENRSPLRKVGELDNRGSHFYLALYWAQELAEQSDDARAGRARSRHWPSALADGEKKIVEELNAVQGSLGRDRRLLPPRHRQGRGRDAAERDAERSAGVVLALNGCYDDSGGFTFGGWDPHSPDTPGGGTDDFEPDWWPEFEREFAEYVALVPVLSDS